MTFLEKEEKIKEISRKIQQIQLQINTLQKEVNDYNPTISYVKTNSVVDAEKQIPKLQKQINELLSSKDVISRIKAY
jgi:uncharacterized protein YlxW (UPF0749 family)